MEKREEKKSKPDTFHQASKFLRNQNFFFLNHSVCNVLTIIQGGDSITG